jgi:hypothetical protein
VQSRVYTNLIVFGEGLLLEWAMHTEWRIGDRQWHSTEKVPALLAERTEPKAYLDALNNEWVGRQKWKMSLPHEPESVLRFRWRISTRTRSTFPDLQCGGTSFTLRLFNDVGIVRDHGMYLFWVLFWPQTVDGGCGPMLLLCRHSLCSLCSISKLFGRRG